MDKRTPGRGLEVSAIGLGCVVASLVIAPETTRSF
jgi:hypothetical protein